MRLDQYIATRENISRNRAQMYIREGNVSVDGQIERSVSRSVDSSESIILSSSELSGYVSRSALKLKKFLEQQRDLVDIRDAVCIDVGASTGGFTQVLLEHGARLVYAIDVGTDQLAPIIAKDSRVKSFEKSDIRTIELEKIDKKVDVIVVDVSFISLLLILDGIAKIISQKGSGDVQVYFLWKPQFEVGKSNLTKNGVVKDEKVRLCFFRDFLHQLETSGFEIMYSQDSQLSGEEGNKEIFIAARFSSQQTQSK